MNRSRPSGTRSTRIHYDTDQGYNRRATNLLREQALFEQQQREFREGRICNRCRKDPELNVYELAELFNEGERYISRVLAAHGLQAASAKDGLSTLTKGRWRRGAG